MIKKAIFISVIFVILAAGVLLAQEAPAKLSVNSMALVFHTRPTLLGTGGKTFDSGVGVKFWLADSWAMRGELDFYSINDAGTTDTTFGGSTTAEYHFLKLSGFSTYTGAIAVVQFTGGGVNNLALSLGAILGVEISLKEAISLYIENHLLFAIDDPVYIIDLGVGDSAQVGLLVYLK